MFRTALLILSGNATASLFLLARNLIVARLIPVEDYGIAATFAVVMAIVEMASTLGLQQQIVQSKDGDDLHFQAALHGFQVLRGVVSGIVLLLLADPIARLLGIPEVIWAYQLLALVPVIKAFEHFDIYRFNRQMRFWPLLLTGGVPALLSLLTVWPLAAWLGDWRVMLYSVLAQVGITAITSHLVAERSYRIVFDRAIMARSLRLGWPLLVNATLLFLVFQGDKLIVGRVLGMEALAIFAMGMTLTLAPTMVLTRSAQNFLLPQLSKHSRETSEGEARFQNLAMITIELHILTAAGFMFLIAILDRIIIITLLGEKYSELVDILITIAVIQSIRVLKAGPSVIAFSNGQSENAMISNIPRIFLLPLSFWIALRTNQLDFILLISLFGELIGLLIAFILIRQRSGVFLRTVTFPFSLILLLFSFCILQMNVYFLSAVLVMIVVTSFLTMQKFWSYLTRIFGSRFRPPD